MTEKELKQYLQTHFPKESTSCEWKEFKNLKHFVKGHEGEDVISYVSAIANMEGGHLIIGVEDSILDKDLDKKQVYLIYIQIVISNKMIDNKIGAK